MKKVIVKNIGIGFYAKITHTVSVLIIYRDLQLNIDILESLSMDIIELPLAIIYLSHLLTSDTHM